MTAGEAGQYAGRLLRSLHGQWRNTQVDAVDWCALMAFQAWTGDAPSAGFAPDAPYDMAVFRTGFELTYCPEQRARLAHERRHHRPLCSP